MRCAIHDIVASPAGPCEWPDRAGFGCPRGCAPELCDRLTRRDPLPIVVATGHGVVHATRTGTDIMIRAARTSIILCTGIALAIATAASATAAPTTDTLSCGDTVTTSVTLTEDLLDCPGDGLVVGADGVTIDLNGHTVSGVWPSSGIRIEGFDGVTVRNGVLWVFNFGVDAVDADRLTLSNLDVTGELYGVNLLDSDSARITDSTLTGLGAGIHTESSDELVVVRNTFPGGVGDGFTFLGTNDSRFADNLIGGANTAGLTVTGDRNRVTRNQVSSSMSENIRVSGNDNLVNDNVTSRSDSWSIIVQGAGNVVVRNEVSSSWIGILASGPAVTLRQNVVRNNVNDGIVVEGATPFVARNVAVGNGLLGITSAEPADGTRNVAYDNGDPRQCVNVDCITSPPS